jgi:biotin carboxylase
MNHSRKVCAIVDAYSSSSLYAPALKERGYECIAIQSQAAPTNIIAGSFKPDDFCDVLKFSGDLDQLVAELKKRNVQLIVPGMEMGLELADAIGEKMGSHIFNDPQTSHLRRNKFDMIEAVRRHGLAAVRQTKASSLGDTLKWAKETNIWPLVMKPADSGGSDHVFLCNDEREIDNAFHSSLGSLGRQGRVINEVVLQEFMPGTEYIVDTVSLHGHHMIVDIWKYNRVAVNGAQFVYDTKELMPFEGDIQSQLIAYTKRALDAVGLKSGPSHNEIMMTSNGPMLVEVNARLGGSMGPILNRQCLGRGQLDFMMDVLLAPDRFLEEYQKPYKIRKHGLAVYLISKDAEYVVNSEAIGQVKSLPSYYSAGVVAPGTRLVKTVDMFTMPGMVELVHDDSEQIWWDYDHIRQLESSGQFYVKPIN